MLHGSGRARPKKRRIDCVKVDMAGKNVTREMTVNTRVWEDKTCCADLKENYGRRKNATPTATKIGIRAGGW